MCNVGQSTALQFKTEQMRLFEERRETETGQKLGRGGEGKREERVEGERKK